MSERCQRILASAFNSSVCGRAHPAHFSRHPAARGKQILPDSTGRVIFLTDALGVVGGYIASSATICDFVRSFASGVIFSSALPPAVAAGALASIRLLKVSPKEQERHRDRVARLRRRLDEVVVNYMDNPSHIVPVMVRDPVLFKGISDILLNRYTDTASTCSLSTIQRSHAERGTAHHAVAASL